MAARRTFSTAATTAPSADAAVPAPRPVSEIPSKDPRNIGHGDDMFDDLIAGRPDPDLDLITRSFGIPRHLAEALRLEALRTKRPQQAIVADGLLAVMSAAVVGRCRAKAERG